MMCQLSKQMPAVGTPQELDIKREYQKPEVMLAIITTLSHKENKASRCAQSTNKYRVQKYMST